MKNLQSIIQEKLRLGKDTKVDIYNYHPKTRKELRNILEKRLKTDKNANLNDIDVSNITDMGPDSINQGLFEGLDPHNIDISEWNVSNVKNMQYMFYDCTNFNSDLSDWDVSNVTDMGAMFAGCENFNADLSSWDVSNVTNMNGMFNGCKNFNSDLSKWDVSNVTNMANIFNNSPLENNPPKWYKL